MNATQVSVMLSQMRLTHARTSAADEMSTRSSTSCPTTMPSKKAVIPRSRFIHRASVTGISPVGNIFGKDMASEDSPDEGMSPTELLVSILKEHGYIYRAIPTAELDDYFVAVTPDRMQNYSTDIIGAIQASNIATLRKMHFEEKRSLDGCNKFGESILHTACRRGLPDVVAFLIDEAKVDLRVRDDYGRTPMHDACWTSEPNMRVVKLLVSEWPDLLLVTDNRGFTPLQYVRNTHFRAWCKFLNDNKQTVLPKRLISRDNTNTVIPGN